MSYIKQNFKSGDVLKAASLNSMDTQIAKNETDVSSVKEDLSKVANIETIVSNNILNPNTIQNNKTFNNTGLIYDVTNQFVSDFITISPNEKIYIYANVGGYYSNVAGKILFYKSDDTPFGYVETVNDYQGKTGYTVPDLAVKCKISTYSTQSQIMVSKNIVTAYEAYGYSKTTVVITDEAIKNSNLVTGTELEDFIHLVGYNKYTLTNLLGTHGNFDNFTLSSTSWYKTNNQSSVSVTENVCTFVANTQYASLRHMVNCQKDHKYYFFATINSPSTSVNVNINTYQPLIKPVNLNEFEYISGIYIHANSTANIPFMVVNSSGNAGQLSSNIYIKKCGVIDLTESFGMGNEPSKNIIDAFISKNDGFILEADLVTKVESPKPYENKKVLFMGDSITHYNLEDNGWCKYFNEIMNPSLSVNVAVSGATWRDKSNTVYDGEPSTYNDANNTIGNQVEKISRGKDTENPNYSHVSAYDDFDIIIIACGTNDGNSSFNSDNIQSTMVDTWSNPLPLADVDKTKAVGAMRYAYETLYKMYPNARFYYCSPIQTYPSKKVWGETLNKGDVMKEMCRHLPVCFIDTEQCGIYGYREKYNTVGVDLIDGLHPSVSGAKKIGKYNANAVISTYLAD